MIVSLSTGSKQQANLNGFGDDQNHANDAGRDIDSEYIVDVVSGCPQALGISPSLRANVWDRSVPVPLLSYSRIDEPDARRLMHKYRPALRPKRRSVASFVSDPALLRKAHTCQGSFEDGTGEGDGPEAA